MHAREPEPRPAWWRRPALLSWVVAGAVLGGAALMMQTRSGGGLSIYTLAGERMRHGEPIYRPEATREQFTYPPLFALPFVPFTLLPEWAHRPTWAAINGAAVVGIVLCLRRRLRPIFKRSANRSAAPEWLFWLLTAVLAGRHLLSPLENQSHDLLVFLCVMLTIEAVCAMRDRTAGLWAGLGAALKATPLLFAPIFLWQRRWAACLVLLVSLLGFTFLPDLLCPARDGVSWNIAWYRAFLTSVQPGATAESAAWSRWNPLNQGLAGTLYRLCHRPPTSDAADVCLLELEDGAIRTLTLASQLAVLGFLAWCTGTPRTANLSEEARSIQLLGQGAAVATAMTLLSPMSSKSIFCMLVLPAAFCLADFLYRRRDWLVGLALFLVFVLGALTVKGIVGRELGNRIMAYGSVTGCAVLLLAATGRVLLQMRSSAGRTLSIVPVGTETAARADALAGADLRTDNDAAPAA